MGLRQPGDEVADEVLSNTGHKCRVRLTLTRRGRSETVEAEIDVSDTSPLAQKAAQFGGIYLARLANFRAQLVRRTQEKAEIQAVAAHDTKEVGGGRVG